jgi:uncharacterized protein with PIN domain
MQELLRALYRIFDINMKVLLDKMLNGMAESLRSFGHEVQLVSTRSSVSEDREQVIKAKEEDLVFVTMDKGAARIANVQGIKVIHLDMVMLSRLVNEELQKRFS